MGKARSLNQFIGKYGLDLDRLRDSVRWYLLPKPYKSIGSARKHSCGSAKATPGGCTMVKCTRNGAAWAVAFLGDSQVAATVIHAGSAPTRGATVVIPPLHVV